MTVPTDLKIFPLLGQSNMVGQNSLATMPAGLPLYGEKVWCYKLNQVWENPPTQPLYDKTGAVYSVLTHGRGEIGPGSFFADQLLRYNPAWKIGLVPCAVNSTTIAEHMPGVDHHDTDTIYGAALTQVEAAAVNGDVTGIFFAQGGSDANATGISTWEDQFRDLVAAWRSDYGKPNLPVVFMALGPRGAEVNNPDWTSLRAVQRGIVGIGRTAMVCVNDLGVDALYDGVAHYSAATQVILGQRAANAMMAIGM